MLGFLLVRAENSPNQENYHSGMIFPPSIIFIKILACLRDNAYSVSDHHTKESIAIKQATWGFGFLVHIKMLAYTIL